MHMLELRYIIKTCAHNYECLDAMQSSITNIIFTLPLYFNLSIIPLPVILNTLSYPLHIAQMTHQYDWIACFHSKHVIAVLCYGLWFMVCARA